MWRAIRLVLDTGIHDLGWSRAQAIEYFTANSAKTEQDITSEVDRYIVMPAQALAYKSGELAIRAMRQRAEREQGRAFDIRAFHDELLSQGALPLDILDARMEEWGEEEPLKYRVPGTLGYLSGRAGKRPHPSHKSGIPIATVSLAMPTRALVVRRFPPYARQASCG